MLPKPGLSVAKQHPHLFFPQTRATALLALLSIMQRAQTGGAGLLLHISLFAKLQSWCPVLTF